MVEIPPTHPRYHSLVVREKLVKGYRDGIVVLEGLLAHGRGEAFDYLLGERTHAPAVEATRVAAAHLLLARHPVLSVNGNTAVLGGEAVVDLARKIPAKLEVNLFHRTEERVAKIASLLRRLGARGVLGELADARIPGLDHARALCAREGIFSADVVLVPLEDGDRSEALVAMGKTVIAVDLNPLSRTSRAATVTIVDELSRAIPGIGRAVDEIRGGGYDLKALKARFNNQDNLRAMVGAIRSYLETAKR